MGLFGIVIIILFHEITVSNEQDYYTLKDATEASMIEAIDTTYYRLTGDIKMNEEKFVENFTKRFIETSTFGQGNYYIDFYQITEYPAKVSLRIIDATNSYNIYTTFDTSLGSTQTNIVNELSAILDGYELNDEYSIVQARDIGYEESSQPNVPNNCDVIRPSTLCLIPREITSNPGRYAYTEPLFDIPNKSCYTSLVAIDDDGNLVTNAISDRSYRALITCSAGYELDSSGWCVKC